MDIKGLENMHKSIEYKFSDLRPKGGEGSEILNLLPVDYTENRN